MVGRKRILNRIKLSAWPFQKDELTFLYWIDHPYKDTNSNWVIDVYFRSRITNEIKKCTVPWGTLPILKLGRHFVDGEILKDVNEKAYPMIKASKKVVGSFAFDYVQFQPVCDVYNITTHDKKINSVFKNVFLAQIEDKEIHIPVIEVVRSMLAINRKLLYAILEPNALDFYYIVCEDPANSKKIRMDFTREYPVSLLTKSHICHLLWLSTDKAASRAWNGVYRSILEKANKGIHFNFPVEENFEIEARYRESGNVIRIEEILKFSGKSIQYELIEVSSPGFKHIRRVDEIKKRKYVRLEEEDEVVINTDSEGAKRSEEIHQIEMPKHEYEHMPSIKRNRKGSIKQRTKEDQTTEEVQIDRKDLLSTADIGGEDSSKGLEYKSLENIDEIYLGDLQEFIKIIVTMQKMYLDLEIECYVNDLPRGMRGKKFHTLDDGITPRKYALAKIITQDSNVVYVLEIERQGKSLSTLLVYCKEICNKREWEYIFNQILEGLVNNGGSWDNEILNKIRMKEIMSMRIRHNFARKDPFDLAQRLYKKIMSN